MHWTVSTVHHGTYSYDESDHHCVSSVVYAMRYISLNRLIHSIDKDNDRRLTVAQKLDLMRCLQTLKRCRRQRRELYQYVRDHCYPLLNSTHLTQHEQWQYCMRVMTVNRYESLKDILAIRTRAT